MIDRTFAGMAVIMPEARPAGTFDPTKTRLGNFAMNGGDGRQLDVNVDGGDNKDNAVGGLIQNFAYESIQEFQVLQHRWSAESGRAVGGVVNVITKSGTNDFRVTAFGTYRNQDTRAKNFFEKQPGGTKAEFERWEYGGSIGGPVVKDRLFFFAALERFDEPSTQTQVRANAIPQLQAIPWANAVSTIPSPYDDTLGTFKMDYHPGANHSLVARFAYQDLNTLNDQVTAPATTDLTGGSTNTIKNYDFVGSHTWTLGPAQLNQFTFHFQDFKNEILGVTTDPIQIFPSVRTGPAPNTPQQTTERKFQFRNDFSWQTGNHSLQGRRELHPHQARRLFLLRRVRLPAHVVRRPADHHLEHRALSPGLLDSGGGAAARLLHRRGQPRPGLRPARLLRPGRLADRPQADLEPRAALGREHRPAHRPDHEPDDGHPAGSSTIPGPRASPATPRSSGAARRAGPSSSPGSASPTTWAVTGAP